MRKKIRVWRETAEMLRQKAGLTQIAISGEMGFNTTWYAKKFATGSGDLNGAEFVLMCKILKCTEKELTAIPGKKPEEPEKPAEGDLLSEVQAIAADMSTGLGKLLSDRATAQKQDELYGMVRNGFKQIHKDLESLLAVWKGEKNE